MEKLKLKRCFTCLLTVVFVLLTCVLSYSDADNVSASGSQSRKYRMYTRANRKITTYTLTQSEYSANSPNSRLIIRDRRPTTNEDYVSGCVKVGAGNGFIVGENLILTNAHVVADKNNNYIYSGDGYYGKNNIHSNDSAYNVTLYNKDKTEYGKFEIESVHVPDKFFEKHSYDETYDYALVTLSNVENVNWDNFHCFELGTVLDEIENLENYAKPTINIVTYNFYDTNYKEDSFNCYLTQGYITDVTDFKIYTDCWVIGGDSGCLAVISNSYKGKRYDTVVGINETTADCVRITSPILKFVYNNINT